MKRDQEFDVVTGAFGYTGKYIARRLLAAGCAVRTLTAHPRRPHEFGDRVEVAPLDFHHPEDLVRALCGARVLYNTYWLRFNHRSATFDQAVANSRILVRAARDAGVAKIVHVSIANPSLDSPLRYYSGKAEVEAAILESGLAYGILRPTVIFGPEDILINNIAWFVRRFPVFAIPGSGQYQLQPIFVEDFAELAMREARSETSRIVDAVGPEIFTFENLVRQVARALGAKPRLVRVRPNTALRLVNVVGRIVGDVVLTHEEIEGLISNLLVSNYPPTGCTSFGAWIIQNGAALGARYSSEIQRHFL